MPEPKPVAPQDPAKKTSDIVSSSTDEDTVDLGQQGQSCFWNGEEFEQGARINANGKNYECSFGRWVACQD